MTTKRFGRSYTLWRANAASTDHDMISNFLSRLLLKGNIVALSASVDALSSCSYLVFLFFSDSFFFASLPKVLCFFFFSCRIRISIHLMDWTFIISTSASTKATTVLLWLLWHFAVLAYLDQTLLYCVVDPHSLSLSHTLSFLLSFYTDLRASFFCTVVF